MHHRFITDQKEIDEIINKCEVCYVSMVDENNLPYVLPFNFGYRVGVIYLHSSQKGHKIDILKRNPSVCIAFSTDHQLRHQSESVACSYSMKYRSVLAFGKVEFIDDPDQKIEFLNVVMSHYTEKEFTYNVPSLREVCTYKVNVSKFTAKLYGY
jgi:nitroimidazol reductase NimA-like FMN-containing flavoprotein (pyridoxamine 5'-phosphate oxidase superfamily)